MGLVGEQVGVNCFDLWCMRGVERRWDAVVGTGVWGVVMHEIGCRWEGVWGGTLSH